MSDSLRRWVLFLLAFMGGLGGESLLLVRHQAAKFESLLAGDFRVLLFPAGEPSQAQVKLIEEKLMGLPETERAVFVSREDALAALRREDPELVDSVVWVGENPMPSAFEVRIRPSALDRFDEWLAAAGAAAPWAQTRYRPAQLRAILQARLYVHFLDLVRGALLCAAAAALAAALWLGVLPASGRRLLWVAGLAALGTALGMAAAVAAAWPARAYLPWWVHPPLMQQALLWVCVWPAVVLPFVWSGD